MRAYAWCVGDDHIVRERNDIHSIRIRNPGKRGRVLPWLN
jgi:hypothetical protein